MKNKTFSKRLKKGILNGLLLSATLSLTAPCITQEKTIQEKKLESLSRENRQYFRQLNKELQIEGFYVPNQKGKDIEIKELIRQSVTGPKARIYAKNLAEAMWVLNSEEKYETLEQKIALAKETMDEARAQLQLKEQGGLGSYTLGYEYDKENKILLKDEVKRSDYSKLIGKRSINSTQTFDEFQEPKNGKQFVGDCDDFSMALTTIYHALEDYANNNKKEDPFFDALAEGMRHYKITSIEITTIGMKTSHALNMGITLEEDGPKYEMIEPQDTKAEYEFSFKGGKPFVTYMDGKCGQIDNEIIKIYNRDFSAKVLEVKCGDKK